MKAKLTQMDVTLRDIAKMLVKNMPLEGEDFKDKVDAYIVTLQALTMEAKNALRSAYIFSRKAPKEEREDLFQELATTLLEAKIIDQKLSYSVARCDWLDWWRKYKIRQHTSLDSVVYDSEGNSVTLGETLVGEVEFEQRLNGKMDAETIYNKLPDKVKPIVIKRLIGKALTNTERSTLNRYIKAEGYKLLIN